MKKICAILILLLSSWAPAQEIVTVMHHVGSTALAVVQACQNEATTTATTLVVTCSTSAGNLLVIIAREGTNSTDAFTISDSASNTWATPVYDFPTGYSLNIGMSYATNAAAVTSVTVNYSTGGGVANRAAVVFEISGAATSSPLDGSIVHHSDPSAATSATCCNLTTTNANDILVFGAGPNGPAGAYTAGSGYTVPTNGYSTNGRTGMEYQIVSSIQTNIPATINWTNSEIGYAAFFAAFKAHP